MFRVCGLKVAEDPHSDGQIGASIDIGAVPETNRLSEPLRRVRSW